MAESPLLDLIRKAVVRLGEDPPASLDDVTEIAGLAVDFHTDALDECLAIWDWDFASTYANLEAADDGDVPLIKWANKYKIPVDCVAVRAVYQADVELTRGVHFEIGGKEKGRDGRFIMTDGGSIRLRYTRREDNPNNWDPWFKPVYEAKIREVLAFPITNDVQIEEKAEAKYLRTLAVAKGQSSTAGGAEITQYDGITEVLDLI